MSMQLCGPEEVLGALENGDSISLILVKRNHANQVVDEIISLAEMSEIQVIEGSENDLWRMARNNSDGAPDILALVGRNPSASFEQVLQSGGLIWMLDGAKYPVNIGFCIRTAEVSGADAVIVDGPLNNEERSAAKRASMKSHRFIPVFWREAVDSIQSAKEAGFRIIAVEDIGESTPWEVDLTGDIVLIVGGEREGISEEVLSTADMIIRIPMTGFVPSFNLQAPLSAVAIEAQRQRSDQ
ncbi:MAG: RNA methyltransferase [Candidatus Thermoplasmatota archaeon]|nr:RNA methyltransferase [Candidatus Thermoplasmatota archaeon]